MKEDAGEKYYKISNIEEILAIAIFHPKRPTFELSTNPNQKSNLSQCIYVIELSVLGLAGTMRLTRDHGLNAALHSRC